MCQNGMFMMYGSTVRLISVMRGLSIMRLPTGRRIGSHVAGSGAGRRHTGQYVEE